MPITLNCPKCHKPFRVRDESIGGKVRCPSCGSVLQVPAALSPASHFDEPGKGDASVTESTPRPVAEDVPAGTHFSSLPVVALPSMRPEKGSQPPGGHLPGPPSIKMPAVNPPPQVSRSAPPVTLPTAPASPRPALGLPRQSHIDEAAWKKVRGGLGMIRWALFLCVLAILAGFGHGIWIMFDFERAMDVKHSLLGREGWPLWKEVLAAYTIGLLTPAALLLLVGRLRCSGAPVESQARGIARCAALFTFVGIVGIAALIGMAFFHLGAKLKLSEDDEKLAKVVVLAAVIPAALLSDVFTLLFIGQIGWPLRRPGLQRSVAWFFGYTALLPAGIFIGMQFYPVVGAMRESFSKYGAVFGDPDSDLAKRATIWGVIILAAVVMFFLRYAGVAGSARRAIRKLLAGDA